jgi:hypothetical protein
MLTNFGIMLALSLLAIVVYNLTNITKLSMTYSLLVGYVVMILGGRIWMVPVITLFLTFGILPMMKAEEKQMTQSYKVIECNTIVGVICLYISVFFPVYRDILYISFSLSVAVHLAINTYSRLLNFEGKSIRASIIFGLIKSVVLIALPALAITRMGWVDFSLYIIFVVIAMPFAVSLNKKYDYKNVSDITFNANKIMVGAVTAVFTVVLALVGGIY